MVYCIKNTVTGMRYIGSSINSRGFDRWDQHRDHLRLGRHHNHQMQKDFETHGMDSFLFSVLEECDDSVRFELEQEHMDSYPFNRLYNETRFAKGGRAPGWVMSDDHKRAIGDSRRGIVSWKKGKKFPEHGAKARATRYANRKTDIEITMDNGDVCLYESQTEAAKAIGCGRRVVGNLLDGKSKHSDKYGFSAQRIHRGGRLAII